MLRISGLNEIVIKTFGIKTTGFWDALKVISEGTAMVDGESKIYVSNFIKTLSRKQPCKEQLDAFRKEIAFLVNIHLIIFTFPAEL